MTPPANSLAFPAASENLRPPARSFTHVLRVPYAHCTIGNHVYYARYLDLLEIARGEFFRGLGHSCLALQQKDTIFQVAECGLKYLKPARYDDELAIRLTLAEIRKVRFRVNYEICRGSDLLVTGWTSMVCVSCDEKPKRIPDELLEAFKAFELTAQSSSPASE